MQLEWLMSDSYNEPALEMKNWKGTFIILTKLLSAPISEQFCSHITTIYQLFSHNCRNLYFMKDLDGAWIFHH